MQKDYAKLRYSMCELVTLFWRGRFSSVILKEKKVCRHEHHFLNTGGITFIISRYIP